MFIELADGFLKENIVMMSFFPNFSSSKVDENREFVFIVDRSGNVMHTQ